MKPVEAVSFAGDDGDHSRSFSFEQRSHYRLPPSLLSNVRDVREDRAEQDVERSPIIRLSSPYNPASGKRSSEHAWERSSVPRPSPQLKGYGAIHGSTCDGSGVKTDKRILPSESARSGSEELLEAGGKEGGAMLVEDGNGSGGAGEEGEEGGVVLPGFVVLDCSKVTNVSIVR